MHTVIVGNGIIALSTAFRLLQRARPDDRISIVGRRSREGSATLAAAAMLNSFGEVEADTLSHPVDMFRFELSHAATRMWPNFERDIIRAAGGQLPYACSECQIFHGGCYDRGTFIINNASADDLDDENFDAIVAALVNFDEQHEFVSVRDIPNYSPDQHHRAIRAIYIPNEGWLNPRIVVEKLDKVLALYPQVSFVDANAAKLLTKTNEVSAVLLDDGEVIEGDQYFLAPGAAATDIIEASGITLSMPRVFYGIGVSLEFKSPSSLQSKCVRTPNRGLACGIYCVPYFQGPGRQSDHVLVGATNRISPMPTGGASLSNIASLTNSAISQINTDFYRAELQRINVGWRPTSQDTYPLLGRCKSISNLVIATGTKRDGFHLAPLISSMMADVLHGEPIDPRMEVFSPERQLISTLTREQAIAKAVRHQVSAAYQHGYSAPHTRMAQSVIQMHRDALERLHDQVGADDDWGIPPEMLDMYRYGHARRDLKSILR